MDDQKDGSFTQETSVGEEGGSAEGRKENGHRTFGWGWWCAAGLVFFSLVASVYLWRAHEGAWDFSWDALTGKPVAVIDGDSVPRKEFRERLAISRTVLEKQYGKDLFTGEKGRDLLSNLERDVLERMLEDRLVVREARRLNVRVSDEGIRQEVEAIGREIYGSWDKFQASLADDGIPPEYLFNHIRNFMLRQEVEKAKTPSGASPEGFPGVWLVQARRDARVTIYKEIGQPYGASRGGASCCGAGGNGGGCGSQQGPGGPVAPDIEKRASAAALAAYRKANPAGADVKTQVTDYGCHVQVDIEQGGKVLKSYTYQAGEVSEL